MLEQLTHSRKHRTRGAAAYLGLSESTLEKYRLYGGGPAYYKAGPKIVVYEESDLDTWLHSRRHNSTSETEYTPKTA